MRDVDLLVRARWIIPVEPDGVVLEDHALVVDGGRISALLDAREAGERFRPSSVVDLGRHAVIPGLVNAHTHAAMTLLRGYADDLPLMEWLRGHIWPAEARWVGPDFVRAGTRLAVAEMLRGGTTCFNDMYFFPDETADVARSVGIRSSIGLVVLDLPTAWAAGPDEYLERGLEVHERFRNDPLVTTTWAPHAPYTVSDGTLERIVGLADELGLRIHIHVHETADEVRQSLTEHGVRPLERLTRLGLLSPRLLAVHMTQLDAAEIESVAVSGTRVLHCPEANLKLASGFCPVSSLLEAGVNVALGTDGAASNNDLDMLGEMRTAALLAKGVAGSATALPAARALRMATLEGARALGLERTIGSLEAGKSADLVAVDLGGIESQPVHHPVPQIVYSGGRDRITDVWIAGRRVLEDRALTTLDPAEVLADAVEWGARIGRESPSA